MDRAIAGAELPKPRLKPKKLTLSCDQPVVTFREPPKAWEVLSPPIHDQAGTGAPAPEPIARNDRSLLLPRVRHEVARTE